MVGSSCCPRNSQESSPTPQFKSINSSVLSFPFFFFFSVFFIVQLSNPYMTTGKTISLTRQTFVGKIMSLLFNMPSRLVITFLPRSKHLLISWLQSPSSVILEPKKIKSLTVSIVYPSIFHEVITSWTGCHDLSFLNILSQLFHFPLSLSFFSPLSLSSRGSSLSAIRAVLSAYLRLLIFLLAILIPACSSSSPAFRVMYSAYVK